MLLKDLERLFHKELDPIYGTEEVSSFFFMCVDAFFDISRLQLALNIELTITKREQEPIFKALEDLKNNKPIQYILGETEFYGLRFKLNEFTLIPRPETELLVSEILQVIKSKTEFAGNTENGKQRLNILDIGTGSGCIAISLAKHLPQANVFALDLSQEALNMAKTNAELNNVQLSFIKADILEWETSEALQRVVTAALQFDIVVSNPPYVRELEKQDMQSNVLDYEPHLALFVKNENPLRFYRAITDFAAIHLKEKGLLYFEINEYLADEMRALVEAGPFECVEIKKDLFMKDRMLSAIKTK